MAEKRGQVWALNYNGSASSLVPLAKRWASFESQDRGQCSLETSIADLFDHLSRRLFFEVLKHILAALLVPLARPAAILDIVSFEVPWPTIENFRLCPESYSEGMMVFAPLIAIALGCVRGLVIHS